MITRLDTVLRHVTLSNLKIRILLSTIGFISIILLMDWFIFSFLFLKIPNELEWDTSPWYNFLERKEKLVSSKNKKSILVTGSSVALYSYLPQRVDEFTSRSGIDTHSDFFGHVAMSPTDLYYYADEIITKKPAMILYLVNPGDFQMDHFPESNDGFSTYSEEGRIHAYAKRHPVKFYYPLEFLGDHFFNLSKSEILPLLTKSMLYVNRYRSFISDPIDAYLERHTRKKTSYHNYTGAVTNPVQWRKGWTEKEFQVKCEISNDSNFSETVFVPEANTEIKIIGDNQDILKDVSISKPGWHTIEFPVSPPAPYLSLKFIVSKTVSSKQIDKKLYGKEYQYGIRLSQNFCQKNLEKDISYTRLDSMDDQVLDKMSENEYALEYFEKMYKDADKYADNERKIPVRPEVQRLYHLHKVKKFLNTKGKYRWSEFNLLEKASEKFQKAKIPFIIVNNPENPLELNLYKDSEWYKDYLGFYSELSSKYSVKFYDKKDSSPRIQDFIDSHHLTYSGADRMTEIYSSIIKENSR